MKYILVFILIFMMSLETFSQKTYDREWKEVDSLSNYGQPQSALIIVKKIYAESKAERNIPQLVKASVYQKALRSKFEEDYISKTLSEIKEELQTAQSPEKQILHSMLAELYWNFYQQNRYRILDQTETRDVNEDDIHTWDLKKVITACIANYQASLEDAKSLQSIAIGNFDPILINLSDARNLRPTLYDFIVQRAIKFFGDSEAGLTQPAQQFLLDSPNYFQPAASFSELSILTSDTLSFEYQAIRLLQQVIRFHLKDAAPEALVDADLERLNYVYDHCILPEKDSLLLSALLNLETRYADNPVSSDIRYRIAKLYLASGNTYQPLVSDAHKWDIRKASEIAQLAIKQYPGSFGANNCAALIEQIQQKNLDITTEKVNLAGKPFLASVAYRNIDALYFRLLKVDPKDEKTRLLTATGRIIKAYGGLEPEFAWKQSLPEDGDFQQHRIELKVPSLTPGYYYLMASPSGIFLDDSLVSVNKFWVSNISYLSRRSDDGSYEIMVADRDKGNPLKNVKVESFFREYDYTSRDYIDKPGITQFTDQNGYVKIPHAGEKEFNQYYLVFTNGKDKFITESYFSGYHYSAPPSRPIVNTYFFTDRSIYRPGQEVYFKGIVIERQDKETRIKPGFRTTVTFYDVNGQKISSLDVVTNEFGSFTGTFTTPQGSLTGSMNIQCPTGNTSIQVEEYKRPRFEITYLPVKGTYKLGESLTVKGKATAYAGSPISDGEVRYRVYRTARFPFHWWGWHYWMPDSPEMEITNGVTTSGADGEFSITFKAIPDLTVEKKFKPVFTYRVIATVTDMTGETHDAETSVSVGYNALMIHADLAEAINLDSLLQVKLTTTNLNGEPEPAKGTLTIWKLAEPDRVLKSRYWIRPDRFSMSREEFRKNFPNDVYDHEDDIQYREKERQVYSFNFDSGKDSLLRIGDAQAWLPGNYLYTVESLDSFGEKAEISGTFKAYSPSGKKAPGTLPGWFTLLQETAEPGDKVKLLIGTSSEEVTALYEVCQGTTVLKHETLHLSNEQRLLEIPILESYRGNISVNFAFINMNRSIQYSTIVKVPWTNRELDIRFSSFRSKLEPGQEEEWRITIAGKKGEKAVAEYLTAMYDASLDAFLPHSWDFNLFNYSNMQFNWDIASAFGSSGCIISRYPVLQLKEKSHVYEQLNWFGLNLFAYYFIKEFLGGDRNILKEEESRPMMAMLNKLPEKEKSSLDESRSADKGTSPDQDNVPLKKETAPAVKVRSDFRETAFFYPQLSTNEAGEVVVKFRLPDALTRWKMMGLAYTKDLRTGEIEKTLLAQKSLMIFTNVPRFFREGDEMQFSVKITNLLPTPLNGPVELHFFDALTMKPVDDKILLVPSATSFNAGAGESRQVSWNIRIPEDLQAVVYRVTATAGEFSDGEEAPIPVLTNRMLVTESLPLPVNAGQTRNYTFEKLVNSARGSKTLRNYRLSLEFTSNPAWYAVQALPYLMEYPYECAEQLFSRYYANSIASFVANSNPKIKSVFESWKNLSPDALKSNLEKNQELKAVLLEESPWVREATSEKERKQRIAMLFDLNRMSNEMGVALKKILDLQAPNGGWPWFKGMPDNRYITQHIVTGLGHLDHLGIAQIQENDQTRQMLKAALLYLDQRIAEDYEKIKNEDKDYLTNNHLGYDDVQYLYARSYFMSDFPVEKSSMEAFGYFKKQAQTYWNVQNNYMKGMLALALSRFSDKKTPVLIMRSLSETALHNDEMGMYWRNDSRGWFWYQAPIETQALLIEAYDEVMNDTKSVDELKVWLLKQKQTQDWKTTKATTEAVYALLLRGTDLLASDKPATIKLGSTLVDPAKSEGASKPEAGTGYFKTSWNGTEITPDMGKVTVTNPNATVAWGSLYWQYFEQLDKITTAETPLKLEKQLFREVNSSTGPVIEPVTSSTPLHLGDKVVVRVILRSDRDMEYVHLKDMRASAFEPVDVISGYHWQNGLGYYQSTRDASTNFFIGYLPKGTYVFEYRLFATQKGDFSNGITTVQCMYAPEFSAHSEGIRVRVE